jgi:hypothetical protein
MRRVCVVAGAVMAAGCMAPSASFAADAFAYESVTNGDFGVIDLTTGRFTFRGNPGVGQLAGLGEGPTGTVYGVATHGHQLYAINTATGAATAVGAPTAVDYEGLGSTSSGLYAFSYGDHNLYSVDAATGAASLLGPTGVPTTNNFGFSTGSATLYELHDGDLYALNTTTGAGTLIGHSATGLFGAAVTVGGVLYAGSENPLAVYTLDTSTGAGMRGADVTGTTQIFYGLAPLAGGVPEPQSWMLMILGFGGLGAALRRRRAQPARADSFGKINRTSGPAGQGRPFFAWSI